MIEIALGAVSLIVAILTLALFVFNVGKWTGKVERFEKEIHTLRNLINSLPGIYVIREVQEVKDKLITSQLAEITAELKAMSKSYSIMAVALARIDPKAIIIESVRERDEYV